MPIQSPFVLVPAVLAPEPQPGGTLVITSDYTLENGDSLNIEDSPGIKVQVRQGASINVLLDGDLTVHKASGDVTGLVTTASTHGGALVTNEGTFTVSAEGQNGDAVGFLMQGDFDELGLNGHAVVSSLDGDATGVRATGVEGEVEILGLLEVTARDTAVGAAAGKLASVANFGEIHVEGLQAFGYEGDYAGGSQFVNLGALHARAVVPEGPVDSAPVAIGAAMMEGFFRNDSLISAESPGLAIGVELLTPQSAINKAGALITAVATDPDGSAVGVLFGSLTSDPAVFNNQGTVRAETAVSSIFPGFDGQPPQDFASVDVLDNSGKIVGDVTLGRANDLLLNSGLIRGDVFLGDDNDMFDGHTGRLDGSVFGGDGADTLLGGSHGEALWGDDDSGLSGGDDFLAGYKGNDTLVGGAGDDQINGGRGADELWGGTGADTFVYARATDSGQGGFDVIVDLDSLDWIDLHRIDADVSTVGDDAFHLVSSFSHTAGDLVVSFDETEGNTVVSGDINGDGLTDITIILAGDHTAFTNFIL